jgi:glucose-6-phosphate isomerase
MNVIVLMEESGMIRFDYENAMEIIGKHEISQMYQQVSMAHQLLHKKNGAGSDYLGWLDLPSKYSKEEFSRIRKAAAKIRKNSEVFIIIGIGGSYLGSKAAIEMLTNHFFNIASKRVRKAPVILYAGNNISSSYMADLLDLIEGKDVSINIISKSGTTTEPAIAFRVLKSVLEKKYGMSGSKDRIYVTTDREKGALKELADREGYESFVIPDDVGGRFSVLTAVGLLPIAVAGIDIREIMKGAKDAMLLYRNANPAENDCYMYALIRNILIRKGYLVEVMVNYEPSLHYFTEWWKQLFGESEGKDQRGLFPAGVDNTSDLHSMGQFIQDGSKILFETVLDIDTPRRKLAIPNDPGNIDGLNYLTGKDMDEVNKKAMLGTVMAHADGSVPNLRITIPSGTPYWFGQMIYFFEKACGISGYILAVNPFDQPGVEAYKANMFALLGKPGYEAK